MYSYILYNKKYIFKNQYVSLDIYDLDVVKKNYNDIIELLYTFSDLLPTLLENLFFTPHFCHLSFKYLWPKLT